MGKIFKFKKTYHANTNPEKASMAVFISDKVDFKATKITKKKIS